MSDEYNPYTLVREIVELCWELDEDLSDEYWDTIMTGCREDINKIREKLQNIVKWIMKKEEINKKAEG